MGWKLCAKTVSHGRYVTFQLAEVAVPRDMFREILRLIDGLRPATFATMTAHLCRWWSCLPDMT